MELWNEYEGRSIDAAAAGLFPLEKLIRPEGRSAFFSTKNKAGGSAMIRLIESHFDEEDILKRWSAVTALQQPNLLSLAKVGQATMDDTPLIFALMEPAEADLGQILRERPLTVVETRQVATSLVAALQALHAQGFIHENVKPVNVLAVGEVVKLRSDCIREAPEGTYGSNLRMRDVQDLSVLLLQCLTQQKTLEASTRFVGFPVLFKQIIRNGRNGTWGLNEIAAALEGTDRPQIGEGDAGRFGNLHFRMGKRAAEKSVADGGVREESAAFAERFVFSSLVRSGDEAATESGASAVQAADKDLLTAKGERTATTVYEGRNESPGAREFADARRGLIQKARAAGEAAVRRMEGWSAAVSSVPRGRLVGGSIATMAVLLLAMGWRPISRMAAQHETREGVAVPLSRQPSPAVTPSLAVAPLPTAVTPPNQGVAPETASTTATVGQITASTPAVEIAKPAGRRSHTARRMAAIRKQSWRVVAYSFRREGEARATSRELARKHKSLRPEIYSATGRPPFLVTFGGAMSREDAFALRNRLVRSGTPGTLAVRDFKIR